MHARLLHLAQPLVLALPLLSTPLHALAWGSVGHRAVGGTADRLLNPKAQAEVAALLAHDLDKDGKPSGRTTLEAVSTWADEIRPMPASKPLRHYDDIPACGAIPAQPVWCDKAKGECASHQVDVLLKVLADSSQPEAARNEALKWIVHLVGDIHQPMHAVTNAYAKGVKDQDGNATDRGGNDVPVVLSGAHSSAQNELHGVWDVELVNLSFGRPMSNTAGLTPAALDAQASLAAKLPDAALAGAPLDWAIQSNALARSTAYRFKGFVCGKPDKVVIKLGPTYIKRAEKVIRSQITLAGARLARLLNDSIGQ